MFQMMEVFAEFLPLVHSMVSQHVRLTKSRKVSAKNCGHIVANRVRANVLQLGRVFAIAGLALLFDALLPFGSPDHRCRMPC
jgi:hypothetical protein